ncbi:MAG: DNA replication/repair protein RecF, partial [Bacilli bacterium]|nr:DNA replication/repair protein RecF [Bacilli bacterium]
VSMNGKIVSKISDYIFNMKVIMFGPEDLDIIKGSPQDRRNFMNIQISQLYAPYVHYLNEYNKILKNRNEYLRLMNLNQYTDPRYLEILDEKLIDRAVNIYKYRFEYFNFISSKIGAIFEKIVGEGTLKIQLENNLDLDCYTELEVREKFSKKLKANRKKEILQGTTLYGPHRDDFCFFLGENNMKIFASQGQQRMAIICFKMVEIELFQYILHTTPILLLDDIFSELDVKKRNHLIRYLPTDVQIIVTTTDLKNISKKLVEKGRVFIVKNGNVEEKAG